MNRIEVFREGSWKEIGFADLNAGDQFRMYQEDGSPFLDSIHGELLSAASTPYFDDELGTWLIEIS
ncbi:hypothetical protein [Peribacillus sp. SCS-155]|uniref:hypothetical protein n=1 Tax=Peribacillus sedimenti TaxID=3115297 RepID=UPI0039068658